MARLSSIDRLPGEVRELIGRLRESGRTIDEILAKLQELDAPVSRSALGRHVQQLDAIGEQIRHSRQVAEALVARFGEQPESRTARFNIELMHGLMMRLLAGEDGEAASLTPQEVMFLSMALQKLSAAHKTDTDRELKLRQELRAKVEKRLAKVESDVAGADAAEVAVDPAAVLKRIREEVYGILA